MGFDVGEIGIETPEQRDFLLRMIDAARARHRWDALPFSPREDWIFDVYLHERGCIVCNEGQ